MKVEEARAEYAALLSQETEAPQWKTMGDIAEVVGGGTPRTSDPSNFEGGDIPWLTPADLSGYTEKYVSHGARFITRKGLESSSARVLPAGSVLFTSRAPIGYVAIARNPIATNQGFKSFVFKEGILPEYVYWWLKGAKQTAEGLASGTTFLELSGANAKKLPIPVVPLDQQKRIVAEIEKQFSRLDEAVANLKRVKSNLKRYKAAVLKAAVEGRLVETEAERARREGRCYETGEQLLQRILEARRSQWNGKGKYKEPAAPETSDLPELPEGWVWATLEQLCPTFVDSAHRTPKYGETGKPAIGPRDVVGGDLWLHGARLVDGNEFAVQTKRHIPQSGDIVYSRELSLGWGAVVPEDATLCLSQGMCLFRPDDQVVLSYFMYSLNGPEVRRQATRGSIGSAHPHLNLGEIKAFIFSLPPQSEQHRIVAEVDRRLSLLRETEAQVDANLQRAERLRRSILQQAFTGGLIGVNRETLCA